MPRPVIAADTGAAARPIEASGRRPLFLTGPAGTRVERDGPSLRVRAPGRPIMRYPFGRLSRVVSSLEVAWDNRALAACLELGIPIVFTRAPDGAVGYLMPVSRTPSRLAANLDEFLALPDWRPRYESWLRSERMRIFRDWERRCSDECRLPGEETRIELKRRHVYIGNAPAAMEGDTLVGSGIRAAVAEQLRLAGVDAVLWAVDGVPLDLVADLSSVVGLAVYLELQGLGVSARFDIAVTPRVLSVYAEAVQSQVRSMLGRLHKRVAEVLEKWR